MVMRYLRQILNRPFWAAIMPILQAETGTFAMQKGHSCKSVMTLAAFVFYFQICHCHLCGCQAMPAWYVV